MGPELGQPPEREHAEPASGTSSAWRTLAGPDALGDSVSSATPEARDAAVEDDASDAPVAPGSAAAAPMATPDQASVPGATAGQPPVSVGREESAGDLDAPLLADVADLRASWHQIQAGFVDDPREAVGDAATLVEHTVQALAGALGQRQRLLRGMWDRDRSADGPGAPASGSAEGADAAGSGQPASDDVPDTERLRHVMQQYRSLFNQISRS